VYSGRGLKKRIQVEGGGGLGKMHYMVFIFFLGC